MNLNIGIIKSRKLAFLLTFLITQNTIPDFDVSLRFLANEIFQVFFSFILTSCHFKITLIQIKKMRIVILWKLLKSKILVYTIFHYLELSIKCLSISSCKLLRVMRKGMTIQPMQVNK